MAKVLADIEQFKFDNDVILSRDANKRVTQIVITGVGITKTIDITRDVDGNVTSIDSTVS